MENASGVYGATHRPSKLYGISCHVDRDDGKLLSDREGKGKACWTTKAFGTSARCALWIFPYKQGLAPTASPTPALCQSSDPFCLIAC